MVFLWGIAAMAEAINVYINDLEAIENGILWLARNEPNCRVKKDKNYRKKIALQTLESSEAFNLPPLLITSMQWKESRFYTNREGKLGELGLMQVGEEGRRKCEEHCGEMKTIKEQLDCGCCWLDKGVDWCGSLEGGLSAYICGKCKPRYYLSQQSFNSRIRLWEKLKELNQ
jgi:hypothetical protein